MKLTIGLVSLLAPSVVSFQAMPQLKSMPVIDAHRTPQRAFLQRPVVAPASRIQMSLMEKNLNDGIDHDDDELSSNPLTNKITGIHPAVSNSVRQRAVSTAAAALFMTAALFTPLQDAWAAPTGGRMGGSFGGSSRPSMSRSYSSPSRVYSGGSGRSFSQGYTAGYLSRPSVSIVSPMGFGYNPFFPSPMIYGAPRIYRGPGLFNFFTFGVFSWVALQVASSVLGGGISSRNRQSSFFEDAGTSALGRGVSVAQVSVAVEVPNRDDPNSILSFLERLSQTAQTDTRVGVSNLVSQVAIELLRQKKSVFAADTSYKHFREGTEAQREFNNIAVTERSKFERETVNTYGGVNYSSSSVPSSVVSGKATVAVVTLIIAIDGDRTKVPRINSISDLEKTLTQIASDVKVDSSLRSAEILWTPEQRGDVLSERDVFVDYPKLRSI